MIIKLCCEQDITAVGAFYDNVVKHLCEHINNPKWEYKIYPCEESVRTKTKDGCQFMGIENDRIISAFVLNDDPDVLEQGEYMVCHTLATEPILQGTGIGKKIVEYCIAYAKNHGFKAIRLDVVPDNIPAKKLYESRMPFMISSSLQSRFVQMVLHSISGIIKN